jgi:catechol 2,3-dioxygenase-like lactoylglutathione lyase family enzyme
VWAGTDDDLAAGFAIASPASGLMPAFCTSSFFTSTATAHGASVRVHSRPTSAEVTSQNVGGRAGEADKSVASRIASLCIDANDPPMLARFWVELLGWRLAGDGTMLLPAADPAFPIRFVETTVQKSAQNRMHFDLASTSLADQQRTVTRARDLGARHVDVGQRPEEGHVVLADLEGNEFCVIEPGNQFVAGCGVLATLVCDGSQPVGHFWSEALGWPLVWDQQQETVIQSPLGGPKIAWGGPPLRPREGTNRWHFHLAPDGVGVQAEVERLVSLGATNQGNAVRGTRMLMADPDGNEFCVLATGGD